MSLDKTEMAPGLSSFRAGGEMGKLITSFNWEQTAIGPIEQWPDSLHIAVNILLNSRFPMFVWWGPEHITLYNDAYRDILGDKHPDALGKGGPLVWKEIWDVVGPLADKVMQEGASTWAEDQLLYINRQGFVEESYFTFSYSPLYEKGGHIAGVFCACTETTLKVLATKKIKKSEENLHNIILQAPVAMCIFRGENFVVEVANDRMFELWGRGKEEVLNRPVFEALPEAADQGYEQLLRQVYTTGETIKAFDVPVSLPREGSVETIYVNFVYEPFRESDGSISGVMAVALDVTTQFLNQQKVEESAGEIRTLVESAPFPIGVYAGKEMRIKMANEALLTAWGKGDDVIGKRYADVLPELENQSIFEQLDAVYTTGKPYHAKNQRVDLAVDGKLQPYYFNYSFTPLFDNENRVYGVMHTSADVSDLTKALQKIKEAEERARMAIDAAELGAYEFNYETNTLDGSGRFEEIWGVSSDTGRGAFIKKIHPDDLATRQKAHEELLRTGNLKYEVRIFPAPGEMRWVKMSGKIIRDEKNTPLRIIGVAQDITEQKLFAEELGKQVKERTAELENAQQTLLKAYGYLQAIINKFETALASLVPVIENDRIIDFRFKMTNDAYSFYSGLSPASIQDKLVSEVFPGYLQTEAFSKYIETFTTGKVNKWDLHYNQDGLDVYLTVTVTKMGNEVVVHFTDFTSIKSLQVDLVKNIEELQRSNKNLEDFAYAASHDLKEPIRKIHFFSDKLKRDIGDQLTPSQSAIFSKLEVSMSRMRSLVDDLLTYSQVNIKPLKPAPVQLAELLPLVLSDLELEIAETNANIIFEDLPQIMGYERQLQQLFQNLISNALKYKSPVRAPQIHIRCQKIKGVDAAVTMTSEEKAKSFYQVSVADNGIGFDQQEAEIIFHVFQRLHVNTEYRGTGVGLSIARRVAENHGGYIWATGKPGEGAIFNILFPVS